MKKILINNLPKQNYNIPLEDNTEFNIYLYYSSQNRYWFYDIEYGDFVAKGYCLTTFPNILHAYRNQIPFGIRVSSVLNIDPREVDSFSKGTCEMFLLSEDEVKEVDALF